MKKDTQVKVLVVGDSGVGKSQLVNVLTSRYKSNQSKWTIGVNIEVAVHVYHPASDEATYLVELWDISGNQAHKNSRSVFYRGTYFAGQLLFELMHFVDFHALICVHDLTNRKSLSNLMATSEEVLEGDPESGIRNVPILLVGTKQNEVPPSRRGEVNERAKRMAEGTLLHYIITYFYRTVIGAEFLNLDTHDPKVLTPGGTTKIGILVFMSLAN